MNPGQNTIRRRSTESSVTIPFERTFRNLDQDRPAAATTDEASFNFCGCGWPQHMLVPKGLPEGLRCELFVMVSNYEDDRVSSIGLCCLRMGSVTNVTICFIRSIKIWLVHATMLPHSVVFVIVFIPIDDQWVIHSTGSHVPAATILPHS